MEHTTTIVIGAGHAGLAMSRRLTQRSIDHVVLERGEVANSWRTERWDSLRLLTPNWQASLPGHRYRGTDPDGFMRVAAVADLVTHYARAINAPVLTHATVQHLRFGSEGYQAITTQGCFTAPTVVVASGACNVAVTPPCVEAVPPGVEVVTPMDYRTPDQLPAGGVLVVGGSATGVQLAHEIHASGRPVVLSVGEHVRMPRTYRGRDVFWWLDRAGVLDERYDEVDDLVRARHLPSPQLIGTADRRTLDLNALTAAGVRVVGRLGTIRDGAAQFGGSLANLTGLADLKLDRLLTRFDEWAREAGVDDTLSPPERPSPTLVDDPPLLHLPLGGQFRSIVFATGYRPDQSWVDVPVLDRKGRVRHEGGVVTDAPGMYVLGLPLLRRRRSTFISGAGCDSADLARHLNGFLDKRTGPTVPRPARHVVRSRSLAVETDTRRRGCPNHEPENA